MVFFPLAAGVGGGWLGTSVQKRKSYLVHHLMLIIHAIGI